MENKHYYSLDIIRVLSLLAILLYHLNILKGGYLAVCTFFVLSGYLTVIKSFKKEKFSITSYYANILKKIYFPLLIVVFITIGVVSLFPNLEWFNLKPETNSVLIGYNNYWQLNANLDYFVRHISSPFMHFWYIAILLQYSLVFPIIFIILKKIGQKIGKSIPCLLLLIFGVISYFLFNTRILDGQLMTGYYGTFERLYSLIFGTLIGFIQIYYKPLVFKKESINKFIFNILLIILIILFIFIDFKSQLFNISMIGTTIISVLLINFGTTNHKNKAVNSLVFITSKIGYEVYLIQYPIIFIFQNIKLNDYIKVPLIILLTFIISILIHIAINITKKSKVKILRIFLLIIIMILTIFGIYKYINTEDHTEDMKKLEKELNQNQELIRQKQQEYLSKLKDEEDDWEKVLKELDGDKEKVKNVVRKLKVVGVGDSIMELAIKDLYKEFPNGYFDAVTNRTEDNALEVLKDLKSRNLLGDIVILNIGTNGGCHHNCRDEIMKLLGNRKVYWLNATHPDYDDFNPNLIALAKKYKNIKIVDWVSVAKKHPEYIISDKVHPTVYGCKVYAETIFKAIYNDYLTDFNKIKNEKIKEHEEQQKKKITFIGNDMLIKISSEIVNNYKTANLITSEEFTYEDIIDTLKEKINDKTLSYNIVFMFDKNIKLTDEEYNEIIKLCKNHKIYIIDINRDIHIDDKNVTVIDFYNEISNSYMSYDKIHLSDKGYERLKELIKKNIVI